MVKLFSAFSIAAVLALSLFTTSHAGNFKVSPIRLKLAPGAKITSLKITNNGSEKVTVEMEGRKWTQAEGGGDVYEDTDEVILFPRMMDIAPGEERVLRVGVKGVESGSVEKTYRVLVRELPVTEPGKTALKFALNLSVPLFVKPVEEVLKSEIEGVKLSGGKALVRVHNGGNVHFRVSGIKAVGRDAEGGETFAADKGGWYVLAGSTRVFPVDLPEQGCAGSSTIEVAVEADGETMTSSTGVDPAECSPPPEPDDAGKATGDAEDGGRGK